MLLQPGDILIHLEPRDMVKKFQSPNLIHAAIVTKVIGDKMFIAHAMYSQYGFRKAGVYQQDGSAYFRLGYKGENNLVWVFRPKPALGEQLTEFACKFAPGHDEAESYIAHKLSTDDSYSRRYKSDPDDYVPQHLIYSRQPALPTPYMPKRQAYPEAYYLALNFFRAYRLIHQKLPETMSWIDRESKKHSISILSHKKGVSCDYFIANLLMASIYRCCLPATLKVETNAMVEAIQREYDELHSTKADLWKRIQALAIFAHERSKLVSQTWPLEHPSEKLVKNLACKALQSFLESQLPAHPALQFFNRPIKDANLLTKVLLPLCDGTVAEPLFTLFELPLVPDYNDSGQMTYKACYDKLTPMSLGR